MKTASTILVLLAFGGIVLGGFFAIHHSIHRYLYCAGVLPDANCPENDLFALASLHTETLGFFTSAAFAGLFALASLLLAGSLPSAALILAPAAALMFLSVRAGTTSASLQKESFTRWLALFESRDAASPA